MISNMQKEKIVICFNKRFFVWIVYGLLFFKILYSFFQPKFPRWVFLPVQGFCVEPWAFVCIRLNFCVFKYHTQREAKHKYIWGHSLELMKLHTEKRRNVWCFLSVSSPLAPTSLSLPPALSPHTSHPYHWSCPAQ